MNSCSGYDLIIFTARQEEQFFLRTFFRPARDKHYIGVQEVQPSPLWDNLRIGLVNLGEMGNVTSAIKAFEVLERLLPRSVVMVGLAGGYHPARGSPRLRTGDVGIGRQIFYHSYGKAKLRRKREIRDKLEVHSPRGLKWIEDERIGDARFLEVVRDRVKEWWDDERTYGQQGWLSQIANDYDRNSYGGQIAPANDIRACAVNVSSGEEVIADTGLVRQIRDMHRVKDVSLFEMESYGLGRVCHEFGIPFFLIKGISDYADAPPPWYRIDQWLARRQRGKNDKSRWRAIAAASAVVLELLKTGFRLNVVEPSMPRRPGSENLVACFHPDGGVICRFQDTENRTADVRKCINPGPVLIDNPAAWLCRTYEDVTPIGFSSKLEASIRKLVEQENAHITTFFPYSARDLLLLFRRLGGSSNLLATIEDSGRPVSERATAMQELVAAGRSGLTHFRAFAAVCRERGILPLPQAPNRQPLIARIIILDGSDPGDKTGLIADPLSAAFPLLLGTHVPTYFVSANTLLHQHACTADVTFIDHRPLDGRTARERPNDRREYGDLVALRFFKNSDAMIVSALLPCEGVVDPNRIHPPRALHNLYDSWQKWCARSTSYEGFFEEFPMTEIVSKYGLEIPEPFLGFQASSTRDD